MSLRSSLGPVILMFAGCSGRTFDHDQALANLEEQADRFREATVKRDFERVFEMSHPKIVFQDDRNRKQFIKFRAQAADDAPTEITLDDITLMKGARSNAYAVIRVKRTYRPDPRYQRNQDWKTWVAVSSDYGDSWKFIDHMLGSLKTLFPDFPDLPLPRDRDRWD